jgi:hypothetical protein
MPAYAPCAPAIPPNIAEKSMPALLAFDTARAAPPSALPSPEGSARFAPNAAGQRLAKSAAARPYADASSCSASVALPSLLPSRRSRVAHAAAAAARASPPSGWRPASATPASTCPAESAAAASDALGRAVRVGAVLVFPATGAHRHVAQHASRGPVALTSAAEVPRLLHVVVVVVAELGLLGVAPRTRRDALRARQLGLAVGTELNRLLLRRVILLALLRVRAGALVRLLRLGLVALAPREGLRLGRGRPLRAPGGAAELVRGCGDDGILFS